MNKTIITIAFAIIIAVCEIGNKFKKIWQKIREKFC